MANLTFFQMDQATLTDKNIFRYFRKRCENTNLDRRLCLCPLGNPEKKDEIGHFTLHFFGYSGYVNF